MSSYWVENNLIYLSSNINGTLAFLDVLGKLSVINVFEKKLVYETSSILVLFESLKSENPNKTYSASSLYCGSQYLRPEEGVIYLTVGEFEKNQDGTRLV